MVRYQAAILDADFAIKVGTTEVINVIGVLLVDQGLAEVVDRASVEQMFNCLSMII